MKMILIIADSDRSTAVENLLRDPAVEGYSEIPGVLGRGVLGEKMGNRAFPGSSNLYFAAVPRASYDKLLTDLKSLTADLPGLKVFSIDTTEEI